ncbi:MAG: aromatic hydrocarbon degradation protein [Desulfobulbus sp.]|jgi:long-chain fatty acid transport protein|nr:MAG: aromatic hydrocarbon degradation protein [Desulfobulbus sp.]
MQKKISVLVLAAITGCATTAFSSGYRIPEQSLNSTALSSAYVAHALYADAAYFNPANMSWLAPGSHVEGGFTYIHLPSISYDDFRSPALNSDSEKENFLVPNFHAVSPDFNNFRFGFALTVPAGLAKRWEDPFARTFANEFSMTVVEANPTASYKISDRVSVAAGARLVYSEATVKSDGTIIAAQTPAGPEYTAISRDMEGDTTEFGYNLALSVRPTDNLYLAATYRSEVDLDMEGDGTLYASGSFFSGLLPPGYYQGAGSVSVPLPAVLTLAASYTFDRSTLEFTYDRTFWSDYETLDFRYPRNLGHPVLTAAFDNPIVKDWDDVDAFRLGYTLQWSDQLTLMAGAGIDGNPIPDRSLSFDLPDSDAWFASLGFRYAYDAQWSFGAAYLYARKEDRTVVNSSVNGEFSGAASHLLTLSASYRF